MSRTLVLSPYMILINCLILLKLKTEIAIFCVFYVEQKDGQKPKYVYKTVEEVKVGNRTQVCSARLFVQLHI